MTEEHDASTDATELVGALRHRGYSTYAGVPCSYFTGLYAALDADPESRYTPAAHEGLALSYAAGLALGGERCAVVLQNSGFGNLLNPLASLVLPYRIPLLMLMSLRGWPTASSEEPQHEVMGRATTGLLETIGVPWLLLSSGADSRERMLEALDRSVEDELPLAVLVDGRVLRARAPAVAPVGSNRLTRPEVLAHLDLVLGDDLKVSTTGFTSRDLYAVADRPSHFYMQGSMGHALGIAAGVAQARPHRRVVAIDGDGSALMHLGAMALARDPDLVNLVHIVLDNGCYESTGGQPSPGAAVNLAQVAVACGYRGVLTVEERTDLGRLQPFLDQTGPLFVRIATSAGHGVPGPRATATLQPSDLARRFGRSADR